MPLSTGLPEKYHFALALKLCFLFVVVPIIGFCPIAPAIADNEDVFAPSSEPLTDEDASDITPIEDSSQNNTTTEENAIELPPDLICFPQDGETVSEDRDTDLLEISREELDQVAPTVNTFETVKLENNTLLSESQFIEEIISPVLNPNSADGSTPISNESIANQIENALNLYYIEQGFLTSRAEIQTEQSTDNVLVLEALEGEVSQINVYIEGNQTLRDDYICDRLRYAAQVNHPLNFETLEDRMRLLKIDPLFESLSANLGRGGVMEGRRTSRLDVKIEEANHWYGTVGTDNYSPVSIGSERIRVTGGRRNLTGRGDQINLGYTRSTTGGSSIFDASYQIPLSAQENRLSLRAVIDRNTVTTSDIRDLNIDGESELYQIVYYHPVIRSIEQELTFSAGFKFKDGQTFIFNDVPRPFSIGPDEDGISRTSVIQLGTNYIRRDPQGAWAAGGLFNIGTGLFDATRNNGDIPDGQFFSVLGQLQRVQRLGDDHLLVIQSDIQLAFDPLLPSEQFVVGGGNSVRGYRQNARTGDNGIRFSISDRIALIRDDATAEPELQLVPFIDIGAVWNHPDNPNQLPDQNFLASTGLGLIWEPFPDLILQVDYGFPFTDLEESGDNLQDTSIYFRLDYSL